MKKVLLVILVLAMVCTMATPAFARRCRSRVDADTQYDPDFGLEVGVDLILWEKAPDGSRFMPAGIYGYYRNDFANTNGRAGLACTYKLADLFAKGE